MFFFQVPESRTNNAVPCENSNIRDAQLHAAVVQERGDLHVGDEVHLVSVGQFKFVWEGVSLQSSQTEVCFIFICL